MFMQGWVAGQLAATCAREHSQGPAQESPPEWSPPHLRMEKGGGRQLFGGGHYMVKYGIMKSSALLNSVQVDSPAVPHATASSACKAERSAAFGRFPACKAELGFTWSTGTPSNSLSSPITQPTTTEAAYRRVQPELPSLKNQPTAKVEILPKARISNVVY